MARGLGSRSFLGNVKHSVHFARMNDHEKADGRAPLESLARALDGWLNDGRDEALDRWLSRELDGDGVPLRLGAPLWADCLGRLLEVRRERRRWPSSIDHRVLALGRCLLRFSRPDGSQAADFSASDELSGRRSVLAELARAYPRSGEARVIGWWLSHPDGLHVPPPLPAFSSRRRVLAVLRAGWRKADDLLVIDQMRAEPSSRFELFGAGCSWLGPDWRLFGAAPLKRPPTPGAWISSSMADLAEWSFRSGDVRVSRTAVLVRGQRTALLSDQIEGRGMPAGTVSALYSLPPGVVAEPMPDCRGMLLRAPATKAVALVLPLALPALPYASDRGQFGVAASGGALNYGVAPRGRRCWLPLLVTWDAKRRRKRVSWRVLTVAENGRICDPDRAFAARVSWGKDETLVIYRSLGPPALRSFLGHQTRARFLLGKFTSEGIVEPLVSVD
jgi:hypothetical protein